MIPLAILRHAPTEWNEQGRMQGRADPPLSAAGRARLARWRCPSDWVEWNWRVSPLLRTRQTAEALHPARPDPALVEQDWGDWEGLTLAQIEALPQPGTGLDLLPPGGESPRMVQARLAPWLMALDRPTVAVSHKGVIRALIGLATGWDFMGKPPIRLALGTAELFEVNSGMPRHIGRRSLET